MRKIYLISSVLLVALAVLALTPTSVHADSDTTKSLGSETSVTENAFTPSYPTLPSLPQPSGSLDINLDFRRDGRAYFKIDAELESSKSLSTVTNTATSTETSNGGKDGGVSEVSGASYQAVPSSTMSTSSFPTSGLENLSLEGDVSLELSQPTEGEFKLDASGWVTIPSKYKSKVQMAVSGYQLAPELVNQQLSKSLNQMIVRLRERLPSQFSDLQLENAEVNSLSLKDSKLKFNLAFTLSSEMFKEDKILAQIQQSRFGEASSLQPEKLVKGFFNSLPLKVDVYFDLSMKEGEISLDFDSQAFRKGTKWLTLDVGFDFSKDEKSLSAEAVFKKFEEGKVTRKIKLLIEGSEEEGKISGRFSLNVTGRKKTLLDINASLELLEAQENMSMEGSFYTPEASADLTGSVVDNTFKAHMDGWVEMPQKGGKVLLKSSPLENLINRVTKAWNRQYQYNPFLSTSSMGAPQFGKMEPETVQGMIENTMRKVLMNIDVNLGLKVPENANVNQLPSNYELDNTTYSWTGKSAKKALSSLLIGKFGKIEYAPGITKKVENITSGKKKKISFGHEIDVSQISVVSKTGVGKLKAKVTHINKPENVSKPSGITHQYLEVTIDNSNLIENAEIDFKVENTWVTRDNIDVKTIKLLKYLENEEKWRELPTKVTDSDENFYYCSAEVDSFSIFAVTGSQTEAAQSSGKEQTLWLAAIISITLIIIFIVIVWKFLGE